MNNVNEERPVPLGNKNKNFNDFLNGITWAVVGLLLIFVAMLYMTEISGAGEINWTKAIYETIILYFITISITLLMRSYAKRKGRATEGYISAFERIENNNDKIVKDGIATRTTEYCRSWEDKELKSSRTHVLADAGITLEDFEDKYLKYTMREVKKKYPDLSDYERKTVRRAKGVRRLKFNENYLNVYNKSGRRKSPSQFISVKQLEAFSIIRVIVTTAISSILGVSLVLEVIANPTLATVVMCLVKIVIILGSGTMGMIGGYNMVAIKAVEEMKIKADEQNRFMKWCENNPIPAEPKLAPAAGVVEEAQSAKNTNEPII